MLFLLYLFSYTAASLTEDYCWRDYDGKVPSDALGAGLDRNGNNVYIGQTLFENKIIPGKILHNSTNIHVEWAGGEVVQNENVKILCTEQPQKFEWILTDRKNILLAEKEMQLIKGGFEPGFNTYIGKVLTAGETLAGKIVCNKSVCHGLFTTKNGKATEHFSFRVLSYNPKIANVNKCNYPIDVRFT